ncbi:NUDIX hydrolase [Pseudogemmobacter sp. W21_MBD1_M6]|uniref:NUDIX hydrolase n=1 Tax=Pseudogemmobacter sp. W21_MBD1_M6 TaxID=3240271 RepID=UPI003F9D7F5C
MTETAIRDAATVILFRKDQGGTRILMGKRGAQAAFMPNKFVFPGGAVDQGDAGVPFSHPLDQACRTRLSEGADTGLADALVASAIREVWEETGLLLGTPGTWGTDIPEDWRGFADAGLRPSAQGFTFVFRAITPPGRTRRFDARFFMVNADRIAGDPDDFSLATDELSDLQWIPLDRVRSFDLPFITEVVLAEVSSLIQSGGKPDSVPFFRNDDEDSLFLRLGRDPRSAE